MRRGTEGGRGAKGWGRQLKRGWREAWISGGDWFLRPIHRFSLRIFALTRRGLVFWNMRSHSYACSRKSATVALSRSSKLVILDLHYYSNLDVDAFYLDTGCIILVCIYGQVPRKVQVGNCDLWEKPYARLWCESIDWLFFGATTCAWFVWKKPLKIKGKILLSSPFSHATYIVISSAHPIHSTLWDAQFAMCIVLLLLGTGSSQR